MQLQALNEKGGGEVIYPSSRRRLARRLSRGVSSFLFLAPSLVFVGTFLLIPLYQASRLSMYDWDGASATMNFVGTSNFVNTIADERFRAALWRSFLWFGMSLLMAVLVGFVVALLVAELRRWRTTAQTLLFLPYVISLAVGAVIWGQLYHPQVGLVNSTLDVVGLSALTQAWLGNQTTVLPATAIAAAWSSYGFYMLIFVAGVQGIDTTLYDAAQVDGASKLQQFRYVTIPSLRNTWNLVIILSLIFSFKAFGTVWAMTQGGPAQATEIVAVYVWRVAFQNRRISMAATAGLILGVLVITIATMTNRWREKSAE